MIGRRGQENGGKQSIMFAHILKINSIITALGVGGIGGIAKFLLTKMKKNRIESEKRFNNLEFAMISILHDKIYSRCTQALLDGWISVDDLENLDYLWRGYHNLGGNGTGETIYKKVKELPSFPPTPKERKEDDIKKQRI